MTSEREFIRQLASRFPPADPVTIGIGDDGAVLSHSRDTSIAVVTDMLLDGVHFDLKSASPELVGRKAIAVNLSDLAAMACRPTAAFVSIAVPRSGLPENFLTRVYDGIQQLTDQFQFTLAGGDTNSWNGPLAINVCLTGIPFRDRPVLRSTAQPGDGIYVTGALGGSLRLNRHLTFTPQLAESEWLSRHTTIHSMMDISDGLSLDLSRLVEASGVAAILDASQIPVHPDVSNELSFDQRLSAALGDGEDFVLLFTADIRKMNHLLRHESSLAFPIYCIGSMMFGTGCSIRGANGQLAPLPATGWQHSIS